MDQLGILKGVAAVNGTLAVKLSKEIETDIRDALTGRHKALYRFNTFQTQIYADLFDLDLGSIHPGRKPSNHPLSASLRDHATGELMKFLCKTHKVTHSVCRLYNPTLATVNTIINLGLFEKILIFRGKNHGSDAKRSNFKMAQIKNSTKRTVIVEFIVCLDMRQIFDESEEPSVVVLMDDAYHIHAKYALQFARLGHRVIASFNLAPVCAFPIRAKNVYYFHQNRVEKFRLGDLKAGIGEEWRHYTHFLEDGTYYSGTYSVLNSWFAQKSDDEVLKVYEPLNKMHGVVAFEAAYTWDYNKVSLKLSLEDLKIEKKVHSTAVQAEIPGAVYAGNSQNAYCITERAYHKIKNCINSTQYSKVDLPTAKAYFRNDEELSRLSQEGQDFWIFTLLNDFWQSNKNFGYAVNTGAWQFAKLPFVAVDVAFRTFNYVITIGSSKITLTRGSMVYTNLKTTVRCMEEFENLLHDSADLEIFYNGLDNFREETHISHPEMTDQEIVDLAKIRKQELDKLEADRDSSLSEVMRKMEADEPLCGDDFTTENLGMERFLQLGKLTDKKSVPLMNYISLINEQFNQLRDGNFTEMYNRIQNILDGQTSMSVEPIVDLFINGCAGSQKTKMYTTSFRSEELENIIVVCPTGDLVSDLSKTFKKYRWDFTRQNQHLFQTYERSLKKLEDKHVIVDEVFLLPSCFSVALSFLRAIGYIKSLTLVGDFSQNLFNDQIVGGQDWPSVIELIDAASIRKIFLRKSMRIPQISAYVLNEVMPELRIVSGSKELGEFELIESYTANDDVNIIQRNDDAPKYKQMGAGKILNSVKSQGATFENVTYVPTQNFYPSSFYVALSRATKRNRFLVPTHPSPEMNDKIDILRRIVSVRETWREIVENKPILTPKPAKPQFIVPTPVIPHNLHELTKGSSSDNIHNSDIADLVNTNTPAVHSQKNSALVKRSIAASFKKNPELVPEEVDLVAEFPEMEDFVFEMSDAEIGFYLNRYLTKLKGGKALENQIRDDVNEMIMSFKNQMKGGLSFRNKLNNLKVGQIVRASSKYYQVTVGILVNCFADQLHYYLKTKGIYSGCAESDAEAREFLREVPWTHGILTFDTVKNESRVGRYTKLFERQFIAHFSGGLIPEELLFSHDNGLYVKFKDQVIDCSLFRNSGEIATLFRNFLANWRHAKVRTHNLPAVRMNIKGDNTIITSSVNRQILADVFQTSVDEGTIEVDLQPEWTNYKIIRDPSTKTFEMVEIFSLIGERFLGKWNNENAMISEADLDNYRVLFQNYREQELKYKTYYPLLFNDFAAEALHVLENSTNQLIQRTQKYLSKQARKNGTQS